MSYEAHKAYYLPTLKKDWLVDPSPICFRVNIAVLLSGWEIFLLVVAGISERL
jgi:hypothetical protein